MSCQRACFVGLVIEVDVKLREWKHLCVCFGVVTEVAVERTAVVVGAVSAILWTAAGQSLRWYRFGSIPGGSLRRSSTTTTFWLGR